MPRDDRTRSSRLINMLTKPVTRPIRDDDDRLGSRSTAVEMPYTRKSSAVLGAIGIMPDPKVVSMGSSAIQPKSVMPPLTAESKVHVRMSLLEMRCFPDPFVLFIAVSTDRPLPYFVPVYKSITWLRFVKKRQIRCQTKIETSCIHGTAQIADTS